MVDKLLKFCVPVERFNRSWIDAQMNQRGLDHCSLDTWVRVYSLKHKFQVYNIIT